MIEKWIPFLVLLLSVVPNHSRAKCVQIYYDRDPEKGYSFGRVHAMCVQNLMGHFPEWQQVLLPIENYQTGDLDRCDASVYLGTHYYSAIPSAFFADYVSTRKNVAWMGYGVWDLGGENLAKLWDVKFHGLSQVDPPQDPKRDPGFFRYIEYLGETFEKYGRYHKKEDGTATFIAATEIVLLAPLHPKQPLYQVAVARHSSLPERTPYVLRNRNKWYVAESPFSFMTEDDRYLVFADLLFDILNEKPRHPGPKKPGLIRLEDLHPMVPVWQIKRAADMFHRAGAKFSISLIPMFVDPLEQLFSSEEERDVPITGAREFVEALKYSEAKGASFILHGYTHQLGRRKNPWNGLTGDDFEFWDRTKNQPVAEDSVAWASGRLEDAMGLIARANKKFNASVEPVAWLTPHYQCSALDCTLFGQLWTWTVGRNIYFPNVRTGLSAPLPALLRLDRLGVSARAQRTEHLKNLKVETRKGVAPAGQFYPYEIYGDIYGQRVLPENIGNIQPFMNEQVLGTKNSADLIRSLKRNRVLRDTWGSWFVHPFLMLERKDDGTGQFPGDTREIERVVRAAIDLGYEFIDLKTWVRKNPAPMRPETMERER